jgi:hypothetical protein
VVIARRRDVRGKTTRKTKQSDDDWDNNRRREPQDDRKMTARARAKRRGRREEGKLLPIFRRRERERSADERWGKLGYWLRVTKTGLYTKASPPRGGHSVATIGRRRGEEKQTTAFKATKGGELRETTADTAEGSNDDDGMTEDLTRRLAEKGKEKGTRT